jgi:N-acetylglucosaminyldiphosphoundecaprenol N-acetyl-beta-D-mannosaminyltransferase
VRAAVRAREALFFSTPKLSYVSAVQRNAALRDSVLRSDMSVPDGMPLLWAARLMGVPQQGRVAGSTMFDRIWSRPEPGAAPVKVYFFGGQDGVAAKACEVVNADVKGVACVGYQSPGFGSLEDLCAPEYLDPIRASGADLLVVSIGVLKGQAWIERNRAQLHVPVVSYLGAVVNFVAGTVRRAPVWMRRVGLEWLWRIKEEPALWRRYGADAITYARLIVTRVLPYRWLRRFHRTDSAAEARARASFRDSGGGCSGVLQLEGAWLSANDASLRPALEQAAAAEGPIEVDLSACEFLDAEVVALLAILWGHRQTLPWACRFHSASSKVRRVIRYCCADYLLQTSASVGKPATS